MCQKDIGLREKGKREAGKGAGETGRPAGEGVNGGEPISG